MHPYVAATIANEIVNDRREAARHARATRRRTRRAFVRRAAVSR